MQLIVKSILPQTILVTLGHSKLKPDTDYLRQHFPMFTGRSHLHTRGYDATASVARQYILERRIIVRKLFQYSLS